MKNQNYFMDEKSFRSSLPGRRSRSLATLLLSVCVWTARGADMALGSVEALGGENSWAASFFCPLEPLLETRGWSRAGHCSRGWAGSEQPGLPPLTGFLPVEALPGRHMSVVCKGSNCPPASASLVHVGTFSLSGVFK